jgi:hypothetical protein
MPEKLIFHHDDILRTQNHKTRQTDDLPIVRLWGAIKDTFRFNSLLFRVTVTVLDKTFEEKCVKELWPFTTKAESLIQNLWICEHQNTQVFSPAHLRMETDPVAATLCFLVSRIPDDGQIPKS